MNAISTRQFGELREALVANLAVDFFEDREIDSVLREIDSHDRPVRQKVLALALALSSASSSLVPGALRHVKAASRMLSASELGCWLDRAFQLRDEEGIDAALRFLSRPGKDDLKAFHAGEGLLLREAAPLLETYMRAMSGTEVRILPGREPYTDGMNIYLPDSLNRFPDRHSNLSLYKLAAANSWAQTALGTLSLEADIGTIMVRYPGCPPDHPEIEAFFNLFPERQLALDLYTVIESFRTEYFLMKELPGLMKQAMTLKIALYQDRRPLSALSERSAFVEGLWQYYLAGKIKGRPARRLTAAMSSLYAVQYETGPAESIALLSDFYNTAVALPGGYTSPPPPLFVARIRPDRIAARLEELSAAHRKKIEGLIAKLADLPDFLPDKRLGENRALSEPRLESGKEYLLLRGRLIEADRDLKSVVEETGGVSGGILVKGSEIGGASPLRLKDLIGEREETETAAGGILYDEWDFRRSGYKRNWCSLYEQVLLSREEPFVELTLKRYGGQVNLLRKKFEMLKRERRTRRRQKDGDDIDLDAMVEAYSDMHAGLSPSDNLFSRIERQERNIAVLFLVDMSGSTRGWINRAEKESLVLMSEALETLGDRYAVYGFSSMTRNRCDLFRIKGFDEPWRGSVRSRISGIEPRDYTRMGPFIRHTSGLLKTVDARTKLLIILTDSRPEDWDGYKAEYGIEDTRKALIETSAQGIHPFCITIDREAETYLPHLFGYGHYIVIDDVRKLPGRMTEIYRRLTT